MRVIHRCIYIDGYLVFLFCCSVLCMWCMHVNMSMYTHMHMEARGGYLQFSSITLFHITLGQSISEAHYFG